MCCQTTGQFYYTAAKPTATKFSLLFPWMRRLKANELKCAQWCILIVTNPTAPLTVKQNCRLAQRKNSFVGCPAAMLHFQGACHASLQCPKIYPD